MDINIDFNLPLAELTELLDKYDLNQVNELYHTFDKPVKESLREYFLKRMKDHSGIE